VKGRILVAEDTPTQAAMVKLGLQRLGFEVVLARDGIEAIEMVYKERPDLIVSDVVMPKLNGYQVCRLLKDDRFTAGIPVILLTSLDEKQDMFWGLKSGADKFITKGASIPELVEEIETFLSERGGLKQENERGGDGEEQGEGVGFDVMGRVIKLLDRNLFESTVVNEIQDLVNSLDDYGKTISSVLEILSKVIEFHTGCIALEDEESLELHLYVNRSVSEQFIAATEEKALEQLAGSRGAKGEVVRDLYDPAELLKVPGTHPAEIASTSTVNLVTKGRVTGVIVLASPEESIFTERTEQTFDIISRHANIVIEYARLYERTKKLSITDGLTKIYNHRYFQEQLNREFARSERTAKPLSLVLLDIDHFKRFNDTYGHQQGDVVLKELARVLQGSIRACDVLARYGGEEFAVIMPETERTVCGKVAERLRAAVEAHRVPGQNEPLQVTVSMGVGSMPSEDISTAAALVAAADKALYRAKENGRNRVEM
jgi:two-component system cell cycle response regulator